MLDGFVDSETDAPLCTVCRKLGGVKLSMLICRRTEPLVTNGGCRLCQSSRPCQRPCMGDAASQWLACIARAKPVQLTALEIQKLFLCGVSHPQAYY